MNLANRLLLCFSYSLSTLYCMQQIPVKLDTDKSVHSLTLCVVQKSITMYEKQCWKNRLKIPAEKPIVVHNVPSQWLMLFSDACLQPEATFPAFFEKLTIEKQKELISAAGENALNSPEITALIAQKYVLPDTVQNHIMPEMKQNKMIQYALRNMIKDNIDDIPMEMKFFRREVKFPRQQNKSHYFPNSIVCNISNYFDVQEQLYTIKPQLLDLTSNLGTPVKVQTTKTVFFALFYDKDTYKSQLFIYDLCTYQEKIIIFDELCSIAPTISFDSKRMIISHRDNDNVNMLSVWDISSLYNPIKLTTIATANAATQEIAEKSGLSKCKTSVINMQYDRNSHNAAIQLNNGNMIFLIEKSPDNIITKTSINPAVYHGQKYITDACLLYTPSNRFIIGYCNIKHARRRKDSYITAWDNLSKELITELSLSSSGIIPTKSPIITMLEDECNFMIYNGEKTDSWTPCTLFTLHEQATNQWLDSKHTLFSLYMIRRLYKAHKNKEELIINDNDTLNTFLQSLPIEPDNIQQCLKKYLMIEHEKDIVDIAAQMLTSCYETALNSCKSFFSDFFKG